MREVYQAEGTAWEKARTKAEMLTFLRGSHFTLAVEEIQWLPCGSATLHD